MQNPFSIQRRALRNHPAVAACLAIIAIATLYLATTHNTLPQAIAYFTAMWLCTLVTDAFTGQPPAGVGYPVRQPRTEALLMVLCSVLGAAALILRFGLPGWNTLPGLLRLAVAVPMILFMYPIGHVAVLMLRKYRLPDLGFRLRGTWLFLPVVAITAGTSLLVAPSAVTFSAVMAEGGGNIFSVLLMGFVMAGLAEEVYKMVLFTRLGAWWNNNALGWLVAAVAWALLHVPKWYGEGGDLQEALLGAVRIMPIGLMWSYISYRTKSVLPATLAHGFNVWGLQNF